MVTVIERPTDFVGVSNGAAEVLDASLPYRVEAEITGVCPILFHRWDNGEVEAKAAAAKGSKGKKTDNLESYVWRCENGNIGIPGTYLVGTLINPQNGAAKYRQDPRSPRKSALDLWKAAVLPLTDLADTGCAQWQFEDRRRAVVQRQGITRVRPGLHSGWKATFVLLVTMPEYIPPSDILDALTLAGRAVGLADFRPTFGRFQVTSFRLLGD